VGRIGRRVAAVGAVSVLLGAGVWFLWLPNYRPPLKPGESYGIDVSHHQGSIDWTAVAADGISFAYIKASEGSDFVDDRFEENWDGAGRAGLRRGAYHFFTLCTPGIDQARHFLSVVTLDPNDLPPAVDLEIAGNCSERPAARSVRLELAAFVDTVERAARQPMLLYLGDDFEDRYGASGWLDRPLWLRRFLRRPSGQGRTVWQVMGYARIDGIGGRVDLDVMKSTS
jgi:lysozyme